MRIILCFCLLILSGCNFAHLAQSGGSASVGALVGGLTGNPVGAAVGAGVATVGVEILDPLETNKDKITDIPEEDRAEVLKNRQLWMTIESLGWYAGIIFLLIWFIPDPFTIIRRLIWR